MKKIMILSLVGLTLSSGAFAAGINYYKTGNGELYNCTASTPGLCNKSNPGQFFSGLSAVYNNTVSPSTLTVGHRTNMVLTFTHGNRTGHQDFCVKFYPHMETVTPEPLSYCQTIKNNYELLDLSAHYHASTQIIDVNARAHISEHIGQRHADIEIHDIQLSPSA